MTTLIHVLLLPLPLAVVAAIAHLDRSVLFQSMFHRPVFLAPLLGWMSGQLELGVQVALITEFISLLIPPTGTDIPPDEGGWAAVTMLALVMLELPDPSAIPLVLCFALPVLPVLRNMEVLVRQGNERLARYAETELHNGHNVPFKRLVLSSVVGQILLYSLLYLVAALCVSALVSLIWFAAEDLRVLVGSVSLFVILMIPVVGVLRAGHNLSKITRFGLAFCAAVAGFWLGGYF